MAKKNTITQRIREVFEHIQKTNGLPRSAIASKLNIDPSAVSLLWSGKSKKPSQSTLAALERVYGINPVWILEGTGKMLLWEAAKPAAEGIDLPGMVVVQKDLLEMLRNQADLKTNLSRMAEMLEKVISRLPPPASDVVSEIESEDRLLLEAVKRLPEEMRDLLLRGVFAVPQQPEIKRSPSVRKSRGRPRTVPQKPKSK